MIAAWLHDIGYIINKETHAKHSLEIAKKQFTLNKKIEDCILNHGTNGNPKTEEGKIIKIADKASFINPKILEIFLKNKKDLPFLRKMINNGVDLLESGNK